MKYFLYIILIFGLQSSYGQIISTFAGNGIAGYNGDGGLATSAKLKYIGGIAFDTHGNLFVADGGNNRIRKIDTAGIITTFAGNGTAGFSGDSGLAINASIDGCHDLAFDSNGSLYFSDYNNHRIRKVDTGGIITTYAGNGLSGVVGDGGIATAAAIGFPDGITFDAIGNLYIAEGNHHCVRKIDNSGIVTTIAGMADSTSHNGDGILATMAHVNFPNDVVVDAIGNVYIAENFGGRIRKIDANGVIHTIAGTGFSGYNGDNIAATAAQINHPTGLEFDHQWNLYIAESTNNRIRKIDATGIITTVAGIGIPGFSGDGGPATMAKLKYPYMLTFDASGNMFIADDFNNRVRKVTSVNVGILNTYQNGEEIIAYPNPFSNHLTLKIASNEQATISLYDFLGQQILQQTFTNSTTINTAQLADGIYFYELRSNKETLKTGKVVKQ